MIGKSIFLSRTDGSKFSAVDESIATVSAYVTTAAAIAWHKDWPYTYKNIDLYFGRIIALSGDYYSNVDDQYTPICGAFYNVPQGKEAEKARFKRMVKALQQDFNNNLYPLMFLLDQEHQAIEDTRVKKTDSQKDMQMAYQFAQVYHEHYFNMPSDTEFIKWTSRSANANLGLYPWLAFINADHFVSDCPRPKHHGCASS